MVAIAAALLLSSLSKASATEVSAPATVVISLDTSSAAGGSGEYTHLPSIAIIERLPDDLSPGVGVTLVLAAPGGFEFNPGVGRVFGTFGLDVTAAAITVSATHITVTLDVPTGFLPDAVVVSDIEVRPNNLVPTVGAIHRPVTDGGTAVIRFVLPSASSDGSGGTSFGLLMSVPGATQSVTMRFVDGNRAIELAESSGGPRVRLTTRDRFGNMTSVVGGRIDPGMGVPRAGQGRR